MKILFKIFFIILLIMLNYNWVNFIQETIKLIETENKFLVYYIAILFSFIIAFIDFVCYKRQTFCEKDLTVLIGFISLYFLKKFMQDRKSVV